LDRKGGIKSYNKKIAIGWKGENKEETTALWVKRRRRNKQGPGFE